MVALEQGHAQGVFERLDLAADRRLRDEELLRRLREAQQAGGGLEAADQVERRQGARHLSHSLTACNTFKMIV